MQTTAKRAYLVLADGTVFRGYAMGQRGEAIGEVVFNTCLTSFQTVLNDPTYYGQLVAQTFPLVGNRGVAEKQEYGLPAPNSAAKGYIVREWCDTPNDIGGGVTIDEFLKQKGVVGISGVDTRRLTRTLRDKGYFKGAITDTLVDFDALLDRIAAYSVSGAVAQISIAEAVTLACEEEKYHIIIPDFGFPRTMLASFLRRGCKITVVPAQTSVADILRHQPDGIVLPDGPADPDDNPELLKNIRALQGSGIALLGIGLGHQIMALAAGGIVTQMPKGHRGSNQPVRVLGEERVMVTTQNHAYDVAEGSLPEDVASVTMVNVNDLSVEGLQYHNFPGYSVQFCPLDHPIYSDSAWIYDLFLTQISQRKGDA